MLEIKQISKQFRGEAVLRDLSFTLQQHEMLSILGRSGSGKTTLLKVLAGLEAADSGTVLLEGKDLSQKPANQRGIVYLYQEALLFPHLNVFENIAFGLRLRKVPEMEVRRKVGHLLERLQLPEQSTKMPEQLSGGQRQRVAFGRALVIEPQVLLLDEPFGALDTETRRSMQQLLKRVAKDLGLTAIFVTHDLKEAMLMGDRLGMMDGGQLKIYGNRAEFIADEQTGALEEARFWTDLQSIKLTK
ncbi:MAG: ABC transporter ATP-binding protein [Phaeodactylibacter sp.]|uniref:ABC transporter ATP-binding protein n=1 Tax=Phaeodactylibacter sp. TaxID=1940289 RepID=UPI0032F01036